MARVKRSTWKIIIAVAFVLALVGWLVSGHLISGVAGLIIAIAMVGGALLYHFFGPPER